MNYEQKYLKYKQKYLELKAKLDGGLFGEASSSSNNEKKVKITQNALEKNNRSISVLEQAIKGRTKKINDLENGKQKGIDSLKKNNAPPKEIKNFIEREDFYINQTKKELEIKNKELENEKKRIERKIKDIEEYIKRDSTSIAYYERQTKELPDRIISLENGKKKEMDDLRKKNASTKEIEDILKEYDEIFYRMKNLDAIENNNSIENIKIGIEKYKKDLILYKKMIEAIQK